MHTGRVHIPPSSPGLIRVITTGFVVKPSHDKYEFIFCKPFEEKKKEKTQLDYMLEAQERFVIVDVDTEKAKILKYGVPVIFNLKSFKDWKTSKTKGMSKDEQNEFNKLLDNLKFELPTKWQRHIGHNFEFKYVSTKVESIENKPFVLFRFLNLLKDLHVDTVEYILDRLKKIHYYKFMKKQTIRVFNKDYKSDIIKVLDYQNFVNKFGKKEYKFSDVPVFGDYRKYTLIHNEIKNGGEHTKATEKELPCFI